MSRTPILLLLLSAAFAVGCGRGAIQGPAAAPRKNEHQTEAPRRLEHPRPRLIAPPPAYGNKVVMAKAGGTSALN